MTITTTKEILMKIIPMTTKTMTMIMPKSICTLGTSIYPSSLFS